VASDKSLGGGEAVDSGGLGVMVLEQATGTFPLLFVLFLLFSLGDLWFTRAGVRQFTRASDLLFTRGCDGFTKLRSREGRSFFANGHAEVTVFDGLHPGMPQESVIVRAVSLCWDAHVGGHNEVVSGKLLDQLDHIAARNVELAREMVERRPSVALAPREVCEIGVELLCLL
jgi:hypothetical protein